MTTIVTIPSLKRVIICLVSIVALFSAPHINAQRVFAPGEDGKMHEIKAGEAESFWGSKNAILPRKMQNIITTPLNIYIYSDIEIELDELFIQQIMILNDKTLFGKIGVNKKNKSVVKDYMKKISPNIYEISVEKEIFTRIDKETIENAKNSRNSIIATPSLNFVVGYNPNKKHKKEGKQPKYWYANISELAYDIDDIGEWTNEQAIESVNQLMTNGKTSEQLFASIIPKKFDGQPIQYVVVQSPDQNLAQSAPQNNIQTPQEPEYDCDIDKNIPYNEVKNENTFALIIANEDYNKVAPVPFAKRDGKMISEYMNKTMGLDKKHIVLLENATLNDMRYELGRLSKISEAYNGDCNFIVYYCGHGIPDEKNGNGYLLPVDGYGSDTSTAYSLAELYSQLGKLQANKTVLFTDACFSGAGKEGDMLVAARGIAIKAKPNEATGNLIAFSACQGDETAYSFKEMGHGLLTYYFLKKLQETAGKTTLGELENYIVENVGKTAIVVNGKSQTPTVAVSPALKETWREQTLLK